MTSTDQVDNTNIQNPSPSPRPMTTTDLFFPSKIAQSRSEYQLKDHLKEPQSHGSVANNINDNTISPKHSISKVLNSEQALDAIDRTINPSRRYSSSDIDQQSVHLLDTQQRQLIEQQKKRRTYYFNHTLFSNIYKRTQRLSSADSHTLLDTTPSRDRHARRRHQSVRDSDMIDQPTTSDSVYSRALAKNTMKLDDEDMKPLHPNGVYRTALSVPDGRLRRTSAHGSSRQRLPSGSTLSESQNDSKPSQLPPPPPPQQQKVTKLNVESNNRGKKLSFLLNRRRASYYPDETSNVSTTGDHKKVQDIEWPLKRSYSFDTPFHRETIEALNKGMSKVFNLKTKIYIYTYIYKVHYSSL